MKLKTNKSILKRFKITKSGKFLHRLAGQGHFNAKYPGKKIRQKKKLKALSKVDAKKIRKLLPYI